MQRSRRYSNSSKRLLIMYTDELVDCPLDEPVVGLFFPKRSPDLPKSASAPALTAATAAATTVALFPLVLPDASVVLRL